MVFILIAVAFIVLKAADVVFMSQIDWWWVCLPLACAAIWWSLADKFGYTQKKAMDRMEARKEARRQRSLEALGRTDPKRRK